MRILALFVALVATQFAAGQAIDATVKRIGFPSANGDVVRDGQWVPIILELSMPGAGVFEGAIRVDARDRDGDFVEYMRSPILLNPEAGKKRFWVYATFDRHRMPPSGGYEATVLSADGNFSEKVEIGPFQTIRNDSALVVDISARPIIKLRTLGYGGAEGIDSPSFISNDYTIPYVYSQLQTEDVPDRWFGLESVDTLVWDQPNPQQISNNQVEAIIEWVRRGGKLIVGIGDAWPRIQDSELAEIMPVSGSGQLLEAKRLVNFSDRYVSAFDNAGTLVNSFRDPIAVADLSATRGAMVTFRDQVMPGAKPVDLIAMKHVGAGRVIAVTASLRDLTTLRTKDEFAEELFDLSERSKKYNEAGLDKFSGMMSGAAILGPYEIFDRVVAPINFTGKRQLFVLAALAFVAVYGLVATFGSWTYLHKLKKTGMSWTIFAGIAAAASALGLFAVGATAQFRTGVHAVHVVDMLADQPEADAIAHGWYGYGSALRQSYDFSLAGRDSFVRPLAMAQSLPSTYATASRYAADPVQGKLENVKVRATLKQFEGQWSGKLEGTISGRIVANRTTGKLTTGTVLRNDMPVPIRSGYLLYVDPRSTDGPLGALDRPTNGDHYLQKGGQSLMKEAPAALNVIAVALPQMDVGTDIKASAFQRQYGPIAEDLARWERLTDAVRKKSRRPDLTTLHDLQQYWLRNVLKPPTGIAAGMMPESASSLMLASTLSLLHSTSGRDDFERPGLLVDAQGLPPMDITHWLQRGSAVLLLYSPEPADIPLQRGGSELRSKSGFSIYRVRLPMQYTGSPPDSGELFEGQDA